MAQHAVATAVSLSPSNKLRSTTSSKSLLCPSQSSLLERERMGGCATKPSVLKDEADAPQPTEEPITAAHAADPSIEEHKDGTPEEAVDGQKSLGNLFKEKEAKEIAAIGNEEKPKEETINTSQPETKAEDKAEENTPVVDA
ncbi:hypothetical protein HPP92_002779 [Vanilla planifolia]|uniref:Uncharacterized protein n=1 Tax=Vanilla planifolia TaxID=51239 RepID=A0A835RWH7_VANPL|nr:hypothetical protein HPP92_002779 [Vanilla planifolia]